MDQKHLQSFTKILPIINGLLFLKKENRQRVLKEGVYLKTIFDIFKYQIPVELHEDALYAIVNLL